MTTLTEQIEMASRDILHSYNSSPRYDTEIQKTSYGDDKYMETDYIEKQNVSSRESSSTSTKSALEKIRQLRQKLPTISRSRAISAFDYITVSVLFAFSAICLLTLITNVVTSIVYRRNEVIEDTRTRNVLLTSNLLSIVASFVTPALGILMASVVIYRIRKSKSGEYTEQYIPVWLTFLALIVLFVVVLHILSVVALLPAGVIKLNQQKEDEKWKTSDYLSVVGPSVSTFFVFILTFTIIVALVYFNHVRNS